VAKLLIIYHRDPQADWLTTYVHNLESFGRYSEHECFYLNVARARVPRRVRSLKPDLIVFHYTLLLPRVLPQEFARLLTRIEFAKTVDCPKALVAQDEQVRVDLLNEFVNEFGVTHVFSPSPDSAWPQLYRCIDRQKVRIHRILTGYVDEVTARRVEARSKNMSRPIDIGYRTWYTQPFYGAHGQLKQMIGTLFSERAPTRELVVDISSRQSDALWGSRWFDFLLDCKYTIGVEGGCSVFDWDGAIAGRTQAYVEKHPDASFHEIEAACFPGLDGQFQCYLLSPRHLEAVMTRTCQVLVEGDYAGVLEAGTHYIPLERDLSNVDEVLQVIEQDVLRSAMVERAYQDIVDSGRYSYRAFVEHVLSSSLAGGQGPATVEPRSWARRARSIAGRLDESAWRFRAATFSVLKSSLRRIAGAVLGEDRLNRMLDSLRDR